MGFFDKMFEKKECAICGTELGILGKTKIFIEKRQVLYYNERE